VKQFWKSKTLWGVLITLIPTILQIAGIPFSVGELLGELIVAAGGGLAVFGRIQATNRLTLR
jgi:hypothetical protein